MSETEATLRARADALRVDGKFEEAEPLYRKLLESEEARLGRQAAGTGEAALALGDLLRDMGRSAEAEPLLRRAKDVFDRAGSPSLAAALHSLGRNARDRGDLDEADRCYAEALELVDEGDPREADLLGCRDALRRLRSGEVRESRTAVDVPPDVAPKAPASKPGRGRRALTFVVLAGFAVFGGIAWWRANSFSHQYKRGIELLQEERFTEAEKHLRRALELAGRRREEESATPQAQAALAQLCYATERYAEAESLAAKSVEGYQRLGATEADPLAYPLDTLARVLSINGKHEEARRWCATSAALYEKLPDVTAEEWAYLLDAKGWIELNAGDCKAADAMFAKALSYAERVWTARDERNLPYLLNCATSRSALGDFGAAQEFLARARALEEKRAKRGDEDEAYVLVSEAELALTLARFEEARQKLGPAIETLRKPGNVWSLSWAHTVEGGLALAAGDRAAAEGACRRAVALDVKAFGRRHPATTYAVLSLSECLGRIGRHAEAEAGSREALETLRSQKNDDSPTAAWAHHVRAEALLGLGKDADAAAAIAEALGIRIRRLGGGHPLTGLSQALAARIFTRCNRAGEAATAARGALEVVESAMGAAHPDMATAEFAAAEVDLAAGRSDAAARRHRRALQIRETVYGPEHFFVAESLEGLARALRAAGDPNQEAVALDERAKAIRAR